jgi:hypothetical protein
MRQLLCQHGAGCAPTRRRVWASLLAHPFQLVLYQVLRIGWVSGRIIRMTQQCPQNVLANQQQAAASADDAPKGYNFTKKKKWPHRASHKANKPQLITRDRLDGRRNAVATFDKHAREIQTDLGGPDQLSAIQLALVEAFVGESLVMQTMNAKIMLGEEVDLGLHALVAGALCRLASRLGVSRRAKDITPTLSDLLKAPPS